MRRSSHNDLLALYYYYYYYYHHHQFNTHECSMNNKIAPCVRLSIRLSVTSR